MFDSEVRQLNARSLLEWRERFRHRLERITERYPPAQPLDLDSFADMATSLMEGGPILRRARRDVTILPRLVMLYRDFVRSTFAPA